MKQKKYLLVTLADRNYIAQAKQLFSSVYHNAGWQGDYLLLAHQIPEKELKWFRDKRILIYQCKPIINGTYGNLSACMLDKFYLFTPYFKKWDNIIYLDADIIVRASLDELAKVKGFAAVPDLENHRLKDNIKISHNKPSGLKEENNLKKKYNIDKGSFNAGVFAFNTNIVRENDFSMLLNLMNTYENIAHWGDQLIMNLFFYKKWKELEFIFNIYCITAEKDYGLTPIKIKGVIFHFCGNSKPWTKSNPFYNEWKSNLDKAEFIDLEERLKEVKKWSMIEIKAYTTKMKIRKYSIKIRKYSIKMLDLKRNLDRYIGLVGIKIKRRSPRLYKFLKSFK